MTGALAFDGHSLLDISVQAKETDWTFLPSVSERPAHGTRSAGQLQWGQPHECRAPAASWRPQPHTPCRCGTDHELCSSCRCCWQATQAETLPWHHCKCLHRLCQWLLSCADSHLRDLRSKISTASTAVSLLSTPAALQADMTSGNMTKADACSSNDTAGASRLKQGSGCPARE